MSIGTAGAIALGVGAASSIGSSLIGAHAASNASKAQQTGAAQGIDQANKTLEQIQQYQEPWMQAGTGALSQLVAGTQPGGQFAQPYGETYQTPTPFSYAAFDPGQPFQAPTGVNESNDPGYAFRLQQGNQAIQRAAAAGGGAFSGGTLKALTQYGQDYASNEYQNVYNRALQGYQTNFNNALNAYTTNFGTAFAPYNANVANALNAYNTRYNVWNQGQGNQFGRLAQLAGTGQTATGQLSNAAGQTGQDIINLLTGGANAKAAGDLGVASAWNTGLGGLSQGVTGALGLYQGGQLLNLLKGGGGYGYGSGGGIPGDTTGYG